MGINEETLVQEYLSQKKEEGLDKNKSKKIVIGFAGVPGSGKSTLAKILESRLNALRISGDEMRDLVRERMNGHIPISQLILANVLEFIKQYQGIIIIDSSVDRNFTKLKEIADEYGFATYIISIDSNREDSIKRLHSRSESGKEAPLIETLSSFERDHQEFLEHYTPDFQLHHRFDSQVEAEKIAQNIEDEIAKL